MSDQAPANIETAIGVVQVGPERMVCLAYHRPVTEVVFAPQNAFEIAEGLSRAAYEARFGKPPPTGGDIGYLAGQIKARVTQQLRDQLVTKTAFDIRSMLEQRFDPNKMAQNLVDTILAHVT